MPVRFISSGATPRLGHPIELGYVFVCISLRGWRDGWVRTTFVRNQQMDLLRRDPSLTSLQPVHMT